MKSKDPFANTIRWIARILGSLLVAFTLVFVIGSLLEGLGRDNGSPQSSFTLLMIVIFIIWGFALVGLVLALWKEGLGGGISLTCFALMGILNMFNAESPNKIQALLVFLIFMIPPFLYIYYWWLKKRRFLPTGDKRQKTFNR